MTNSAFKFAQLSDLHISSPGLPAPWQLANKRFLGYLSWLKKRRYKYHSWIADLAVQQLRSEKVDHCVITGDLTHIGLHREFKQINQWLKTFANEDNLTIVPGNHDLYVNSKWQDSFIEWQSYMASDEPDSAVQCTDSLKQLECIFPIIHVRSNIMFIGLSSAFNAPWFRATGFVNREQLDRLRSILSDPRWNQYCKVLLIHHPITLTNVTPRKSLLNHQELTALLQEQPVHIILHGHGHQSTMETLSCSQNIATPIIGCASSATTDQNQQHKAEFLLYEISQQNDLWNIKLRNFNLNLEKTAFTESKQTTFDLPKIAV